MAGLDMRIDLHCLHTAESTDGITRGRYASGLRCVNSSNKLWNSEFMARSKMVASVSTGRSREDEGGAVLNRGACCVSATCSARGLCLGVASEDRKTGRTVSGTLTASWRRRFLWLVEFGGTVSLFWFVCIEDCIAGRPEISEARFVCPSMAYSSTNFAASLSADTSEPGEGGRLT